MDARDGDDLDAEDPIVPPDDECELGPSVDGEAVVVPGQRPGPTEPAPG